MVLRSLRSLPDHKFLKRLESFFVLKVAARVHLASSDGNDLSGERARLMAHNLFPQPETIPVCYFFVAISGRCLGRVA